MAAAIGDRAALPVQTVYTTGRSPIRVTRLPPPPWRLTLRANPVHKAPDIRAGVGPRQRTVALMPVVQFLRLSPRVLIVLGEQVRSSVGNALACDQAKLRRALLNPATLYVGSLILTMQYQPDFKARIGDRDIDVTPFGLDDRLRDIGVCIHIEHAPDLVECWGPVTPARPTTDSNILLGPCHEASRRHPGLAPVDADSLVTATPIVQIVAFRNPSLGVNTDDSGLFGRAPTPRNDPAPRLRPRSVHASTRPRARSTSAGFIEGTAP